jgi:hypothetical protein
MTISGLVSAEVRFQEESDPISAIKTPLLSVTVTVGSSSLQLTQKSSVKKSSELYVGTLTNSLTWDDAAWSPNLSKYVAVATNNTNLINWSADGVSWSKTKPLTVEFDETVDVTLDPYSKSAHITLSNGNLTSTSDGTVAYTYQSVSATWSNASGKWYCEALIVPDPTLSFAALSLVPSTVTVADGDRPGVGGSATGGYAYDIQVAMKYHAGVAGAYGVAEYGAHRHSLLFDADNGTISWWVDGVDQGIAYTGVSGAFKPCLTGMGVGVNTTINFGATPFTYTPPNGYLGWDIGLEQPLAGHSVNILLSNNNYTATSSWNDWAAAKVAQVGSGTKEFTISVSNHAYFGICAVTDKITLADAAPVGWTSLISTGYIYYGPTGNKYHNGSVADYGVAFNAGDTVTVLYNEGLGTLSFRVNGVDQGLAFSGITGNNVIVVGLLGNTVVNNNVILLPSFGSWSGIVWAPELNEFCAVSQGGQKCVLSPDGYTWLQYAMPYGSGANWMSIAWNGTTFVSVDYVGSTQCATSTDGMTWVLHSTMPASCQWVKVIWAPELNKFCAISTAANVAVSADGINWTPGTIAFGKYDVAWNGSLLMAVSGTGSVETSSNGLDWTVVTNHGVTNGYSVAWTGYEFVVVGIGAAKSTDGIVWTPISPLPTPGGLSFFGITKGELGRIVAVGGSSSSLLIVE